MKKKNLTTGIYDVQILFLQILIVRCKFSDWIQMDTKSDWVQIDTKSDWIQMDQRLTGFKWIQRMSHLTTLADHEARLLLLLPHLLAQIHLQPVHVSRSYREKNRNLWEILLKSSWNLFISGSSYQKKNGASAHW